MDGFFVSLNLKKFLQGLHFFHGELFNVPSPRLSFPVEQHLWNEQVHKRFS